MQDQNGKSPTIAVIDGITIDANRISRRKFVDLTSAIQRASDADDATLRDELTGEIVEKIVTYWPFENPITQDGYLDLGLMDSRRVDNAIMEFMQGLGQKKLDSPSKPPESSSET